MNETVQKVILVIDDETGIRNLLTRALQVNGYTVLTAEEGQKGFKILNEQFIDLVLLDVKMPGWDGLETLKNIRKKDADLPVIMLTAHSTVENAVAAMKLGAFDYLQKPFDLEELKIVIEKALDHAGLRREVKRLRQELRAEYGFNNIIGKDPKMLEIFATIATVAPSNATILIQGESGTGKELIARALHYNSDRKEAPFIKVNCAALGEGVLESELFGHEKGAFTGAIRNKAGKFELADKGSILLDEIAEMSPNLQARLLRVLQEKELDRVGGDKPIKIDVRVIATTNRDLNKEIAEGRFREDLYYRLNVVNIAFPPLRERKSDIPLLVEYFIKKYNQETGKKIKEVSSEVMRKFMAYNWPGNVRELENIIQRAIILCNTSKIENQDLPKYLGEANQNGNTGIYPGLTIAQVERQLILATLEATNGNRNQAAEMLGISDRTLRNKLKDYREQGLIDDNSL